MVTSSITAASTTKLCSNESPITKLHLTQIEILITTRLLIALIAKSTKR
jgi:hypothetical protein